MKIKIAQIFSLSILFFSEASYSASFEIYCPDSKQIHSKKINNNLKTSYEYSGLLTSKAATGIPIEIPVSGRLVNEVNLVKIIQLLKIELSPENELKCTYRTIGGSLDCEMLTLSGSLDGLTNTHCTVKCANKVFENCVTQDHKCRIECTSES
ncbi:MAG TPA: hypothetical protein VMW10_12915 [Alphaproteobacteria bacterium]|nr:hypothetical protein [Alphaproteobacteria bacterium]